MPQSRAQTDGDSECYNAFFSDTTETSSGSLFTCQDSSAAAEQPLRCCMLYCQNRFQNWFQRHLPRRLPVKTTLQSPR